jgi:hypothetical protein
MSERPHFIQLEPNEDATSVRDRLSFVRGKRVLLVWPEEGRVLERKLDLVLIQREAMRRAIRLALVTHDASVMKHAQELNISTFETIGESERKRWKRGRSKVFANRYQKPEEEPAPEDLQEVASRVKQDAAPSTLRDTLTRSITYLVVIAIVLGGVYALYPSATVTVTPARSNEVVTVTITADASATDIDIENRIIPMTRLRIEIVENGTIETTGSLALTDTRAAGTVVFVNQTVGAVTIPEGTVVSTSAGTPVQFRTTEETTVPAGNGEQAEVPVEALQDYAGPVGNVGESLINTVVGPLQGAVDVRNLNPTSGGSSQSIAAVTESDLERLVATVRQQIQAQAFTEMQPLLNDTQFIILETLVIAEERDDWKTFSADVGDTTETISLNMRAVVEAAAVDEQFGSQIAFANLSSRIPLGRVVQPNTITYTRGAASALTPDGNVTFDMSANAVVAEPISAGDIQRQLANRPIDQALAFLLNDIDTQPGTVPNLRLSPSWMRRMPLTPFRIRVELLEAPI